MYLALSPSSSSTWNARYITEVPHTNSYYAKCLMGGIISCGITHTAMTPLDVVKVNMQYNAKKYPSLIQGGRTIMQEQGVSAIFKGWAPTAIGYSLQGAGKFGLYEVFKDFYSNLAGEENAYKYRGAIYLAGSASAEFFADMLLCPMEMIKVKVQTSDNFPNNFGKALKEMRLNAADTRFPFGSLVPLWGRQIPYTMAKFYFFEQVVELFYTHVLTKPKYTYSQPTQLGVTFASGYIAGVVCAIVSHPADTLVSLMGKTEYRNKSVVAIASDVGLMNLATNGLGPRILMIGTLTGFQWWIYDTFKTALGMGTTGGTKK